MISLGVMFDIQVEEMLWHALSDATRRAILDHLRTGPLTTEQVAGRFPITRSAINKHLTTLEQANLIVVRRSGKYRFNHLNIAPLSLVAKRWTTELADTWTDRLTKLASAAERRYASMTQPQTRRIHLELEHVIKAPREAVFDALIHDITVWWSAPFLKGPAKRMILEPRIGGLLYEDWGGGDGLHLCTVTNLDTPNALTLSGAMGMGDLVAGHIKFQLENHPEGTLVQLSHVAVGELPEGIEHNYREGWEALIGTNLRSHTETPTKEEEHVQNH